MKNRLLLLTLGALAGAAAALHAARQRDAQALIDSVASFRSTPTPRVGQPVQFLDRNGVARPARISRVIDERAGVVDLHVDMPDREQPVVIEGFVRQQEPGDRYTFRWQHL